MAPERAMGGGSATRTVAWVTAKRAVRSAVVWGLLFGVLVANEVLTYDSNFPTIASRERFASTLGSNRALAAIIGPARDVDTIGGFVAWRVLGLLIIVGAVWGMLTGTRLLRREEDAGRWELFLAGRTTRRHATAQAIAGLAAGWGVLWALTASCAVVAGSTSDVGFAASSAMFYATAATAGAAMFLAVGALASQLAATRRQANGLAAAAFAVCYLVRLVADSAASLAWMRWASPLGWVENLRPLTGSGPLALAPIVVLVAATGWAAIRLAGRRDVGAAVFARTRPANQSTSLVDSANGLVVALERWVATAWVAGIAVLGVILGVTARSAAAGNVAVSSIEEQLGRLGAAPRSTVATWIGYEFLYLGALLAFAAAGQIAALRNEEADGHLDNLLARRLDRAAWLGGRLGFAVVFVLAAGLAAGVGGWIGVAAGQHDIGVSDMLGAGLNVAVPGLFVLGVGTLLFGLVPRLAGPVLYAVILWSLLVTVIGSSITSNHWVLDTALLTHLGPVPAADLRGSAVVALIGTGALAAAVGLAAFRRRDLVAA